MRRLFILRPEPGASASADRARDLGLEPVVASLFEIAPIGWEAPEPGGFDALLLTSANAVRCGGEALHRLRGHPVHAVGDATAAAARNAGFDVASSGDSGVDRLLGSIEQDLRLLHLCGEHRKSVDDAPQKITQIAVYRSAALDEPQALSALAGQVAAVHSPRSAERLAQLVDDAIRSSVRIAAISEAAASAAGDGWERIEAASEPNDQALLALARRLCEDAVRP